MDNKLMNKKSRSWCFTTFNVEKYEEWKNIKIDNNITYMVYQEEKCGKTGKLHLQGYLEYKNPTTMSMIKRILNDESVHLETRKGTKEQASNYCKKDDTKTKKFIEFGDVNLLKDNSGKRKDLENIYEMIKDGNALEEIAEIYPAQYIRYYKGIKEIKNLIDYKKLGSFKQIDVNVLYGKAGTGKTSYIYDKHGAENCYKLEKGNSDNLWFDGYNGQKVLIIDDFYGWIKYGKMLNLLDGYKMLLEIKGGTTISNWDYVYITSNNKPNQWYKQGMTPALNRRLNNVYNLKEIGKLYCENKYWNITKKELAQISWQIIEEDCEKINETKIETKTTDTNTTTKELMTLSQRLTGNTIQSIHSNEKPLSWKQTIQNVEEKRLLIGLEYNHDSDYDDDE